MLKLALDGSLSVGWRRISVTLDQRLDLPCTPGPEL